MTSKLGKYEPLLLYPRAIYETPRDILILSISTGYQSTFPPSPKTPSSTTKNNTSHRHPPQNQNPPPQPKHPQPPTPTSSRSNSTRPRNLRQRTPNRLQAVQTNLGLHRTRCIHENRQDGRDGRLLAFGGLDEGEVVIVSRGGGAWCWGEVEEDGWVAEGCCGLLVGL